MIYISYNNGRVLQGIVLALGDRRVRIAVKGSDDAVELCLLNHVWVSEDCEVVRVEFHQREVSMEAGEADLLEAMFPSRLQPAPGQRVM